MPKNEKRGGARPGSGRPKTYQTGRARSVSLHVYLSEEEDEKLETLANARETSKTEIVRALIRKA